MTSKWPNLARSRDIFENALRMNNMLDIKIQESLDLTNLRDIDGTFIISSAKAGNGVEQLRDNNNETYWQSDGIAPHIVNIQFNRNITVAKVCIYVDYNLDESYTPKKLSLRTGTTQHDLTDIATFELNEPVGWIVVTVGKASNLQDVQDDNISSEYLRTHLMQLKVASMHQNGRDSHIRQIRILGPRASPSVMADFALSDFCSPEMTSLAVLR